MKDISKEESITVHSITVTDLGIPEEKDSLFALWKCSIQYHGQSISKTMLRVVIFVKEVSMSFIKPGKYVKVGKHGEYPVFELKS